MITDREDKIFSGIDRHFADFMVRLSGSLSEKDKKDLWLASALVSYFTGMGNICINLASLAEKEFLINQGDDTQALKCPALHSWIGALQKSPVIGKPGEQKPLILNERYMLYLNRYWHYEKMLVENIINRLNADPPAIDQRLLEEGLDRLFPEQTEGETDWQRISAMNAVKNNFVVISGGPGTGKTFTVAKILVLLIEQAKGKRCAIALTAPTGKAAARLKTVIKETKERLDCSYDIKILIPEESSTIHRLLGSVHRTKRFRYNEENLLPYDVVIVDEASMIDLPLMAKLLSAVSHQSRVILLGDKDQLASVEPGAVFGDLCSADRPLKDYIFVLKKNYRFSKESGIGILSEIVNTGDGYEALKLLKGGAYNNISWRDIPSPDELPNLLKEKTLERYSCYIKSESPEEAFLNFDRFHVICALRQGPYGVTAVNEIIEYLLRRDGFIKSAGKWYKGQPLMVTANDYHIKLFNGDVGILLPDRESDGMLRAFFKTEEGAFRKILPARLSNFETVYSITAHKSQGSEFDDIIIILPDRFSEVVTRELIYTAITRAKKSVEIWGNEEVFCESIARRIERQSGMKDAISAIRQNQGL